MTKIAATEWYEGFLAQLRVVPNITKAALAVGKTRRGVFLARKNDPEFAAAWDEAIAEGVDAVEAAAFRRAAEGDYKFASMILRVHRPKYRKALQTVRNEHSNADGKPLSFALVRDGYFDHDEAVAGIPREIPEPVAALEIEAGSDDDPDDPGADEVRGDGAPVGEVNDGG